MISQLIVITIIIIIIILLLYYYYYYYYHYHYYYYYYHYHWDLLGLKNTFFHVTKLLKQRVVYSFASPYPS